MKTTNQTSWVKIYSAEQAYKCNILKALLDEYQIEYHELNRKDSSYIMLGEMEIYVPVGDEIFVRLLITQNEL